MSFSLDQKVIFAARGCNLELLKERIACGGNINYQDTKYGSALISAINNSDFPMVLFLIENGADVNAENAYGIVPLEVALQQSTDEIVRILAWSGARLKSRSRPHWRERLELCLRDS